MLILYSELFSYSRRYRLDLIIIIYNIMINDKYNILINISISPISIYI